MSGVKVKLTGGREAVERLGAIPEKSKAVLVMALNDTVETLRAQFLREIGSDVNIKRNLLRERVRITRATRGRLVARLWAVKRGLVLSHFPHKQVWTKGKSGKRKRAGVRVNVGGTAKVLKNAFIVSTLGSDSTNGLIFVRYGPKRTAAERKGQGAYGSDLLQQRIRALYGPSPSQILETRKPDFQAEGQRILVDEVERQLKRADL
ncbi:MAG: phage tail protein [Pseudomonadota bacterium]